MSGWDDGSVPVDEGCDVAPITDWDKTAGAPAQGADTGRADSSVPPTAGSAPEPVEALVERVRQEAAVLAEDEPSSAHEVKVRAARKFDAALTELAERVKALQERVEELERERP